MRGRDWDRPERKETEAVAARALTAATLAACGGHLEEGAAGVHEGCGK